MHKSRKIPPDGGYGWVIVFANALSNFIIIPLIHCFGLIFKDTFTDLGMSAAEGSLIINLNAAFGMMTGLINGVLLKIYGFRKMAIVAAFLLTLGVTLTSKATTFAHFIVTYGLITSLGSGLCQSAFGLAINTYFKEKRSLAMGYAQTATGFGPILIPQLIGYLIKIHTPGGVILIFGGICAHVFIAATLLQPVKWHMKDEPEKEGDIDDSNKNKDDLEEETNILNENRDKSEEPLSKPQIEDSKESSKESSPAEETELLKKSKKKSKKSENVFLRIGRTIAKTFDLDLLKDPVFVNIMLGMALAIFAELNFTVLTPFMLNDFGLTTDEIATFLSTLGVADIIFRFFAPYIGNYFTKPPRLMYAYALILLIFTRFTFLLSRNFYLLLIIALGLGIAKGIRKVYMGLVIPAHVPLEKLPSANGMEMMMNGFCIIIGGPLLGVVRDVTGSYTLCIIIMNCVTFTCIFMWLVEAAIVKYKSRKNHIPENKDNILLQTTA